MSTVDTHLNWNASYFVTDVYQRFIAPDASQAQCVRVSRWAVLGYAALAIVVAYFMTSIESAVVILFNLQAGIGMVLILRWFWWRINAWSEISAMIASLVANTSVQILLRREVITLLLIEQVALTVGFSTLVWVTVTLLTQPTKTGHLVAFYRRVRPARLLWGPIARQCPEVSGQSDNLSVLLGWLVGALGLYALMFVVGKIVLAAYAEAAIAAGVLLVCAAILRRLYRHRASPLSA
jgi:SSS family solute:Na+ symporter